MQRRLAAIGVSSLLVLGCAQHVRAPEPVPLSAPPARAAATSGPEPPSLGPVDRRVQELLGRMTLAEKVAQLRSVNWDHTHVYDEKTGLFSPEKAKSVMPDGIGEVTRPGAGKDPQKSAELANAIQRFLVEQTRLGIPAILHEEAL